MFMAKDVFTRPDHGPGLYEPINTKTKKTEKEKQPKEEEEKKPKENQ